ncbi:MAG: sensor domain-containing diguanylate cyclase [Candidatus Thiodiazotropha endolucinida]|uniref:Sensor domain-containing diguanylate cyclase n=1 Tax=Candidatus Thiodiazotropha taylori TaxID=2792791 RepID=A0A9E4JT83_9GAMM|nr:sensor domain-containing diguanylate cyclase [Candidatus Thiodiazotropha sp. (ex Lucina pensylvanica)]MCG7875564.1 sensor domain-containing diguanylate cyclase [Candidatus Thiodiazotropha taylori]MCW4223982.1 sensor domain-containing diguanylate cyclase [Candidatus Thiodiazotropha endolucinida]MCG7883530.1 sensor domain-containing diguanylate cyclase [Candidatus Thiodiazotropha taylori]MCG7885559.1 sensor domain-containing diguanylate cyclase [Candidatus Thiodiazotropha taylori]
MHTLTTEIQERVSKILRENKLLEESLRQSIRLGKLREKALNNLINVERQLKKSEARFKSIAMATREGIIIVDREARILFWNPAAEKILGYTAADVTDRNIHELLVPERLRSNASEHFSRFVDEYGKEFESWTKQFPAVRKNGEETILELTVSPFESLNGWQALGSFRDIAHQKLEEERLKFLASHDPMTGLYNRRGLAERFAQDLKRAKRYRRNITLLLLDVDNLKKINDTFGHHIGDEVLHRISEIIEYAVRDVDYVSRFGGDEFIVVLGETQLDQATTTAERIRKRAAKEIHSMDDGQEISSTVSIGVSMFPDHGHDLDSLVDAADSALYRAKKKGRNAISKAAEKIESKV